MQLVLSAHCNASYKGTMSLLIESIVQIEAFELIKLTGTRKVTRLAKKVNESVEVKINREGKC